VAAQVWLVSGGKANIFKLAYVQGYEKLSTGSVLTAELMRHVMDVDRVHEVDFLSGDDAYKADWMDCRRERVGLLAFDQRHWRGWLAMARHQLRKLRRAWSRRAD
jgi:CelD/BcsL family acetyltransferase involved in cellulose biosynthesis